MSKESILQTERADAQELVSAVNNDAAAGAFLARQLTQVRAKTIDVKHAALESFSFFPTQTEIAKGADTAVQYVYDTVGIAALISDYAKDLPRADVLASESAVKVKDIGAAYGYNKKELANAAFANKSLSMMKANAVKRAIDQKLDKIAWKGEATANIVGFFDNTNVSEFTLALDAATSTSTKLADKTAQEIFDEMSNLILSVSTNTNNVEDVNTFAISPAGWNAMATKYFSVSGIATKTVLEVLKENNPQITRWLKLNALKNADVTGTKDLAVVGYFDPDYIRFEIPDRFSQEPVEKRGLEYIVNCTASVVGVTIFRPYCFTKAEGV